MAKRAVYGITATRAQAEEIVTELRDSGFRSRDISILFSDEAQDAAVRLDAETERYETSQSETKAPEGAAIGASAGTILGGALGLLAGIGALVIPGLGPFIAAGPIMATLGGVGVGAAVGGVAGALVGLGIPEHHARAYETRLKEGGTLVAAHCDDAADLRRVADLFARRGATDITTSFDGASAGYPRTAGLTSPTSRR